MVFPYFRYCSRQVTIKLYHLSPQFSVDGMTVSEVVFPFYQEGDEMAYPVGQF